MGGTLPVLVKFFVKKRERLGWNVGQLYAVNTFGAVVGTLSAGFFLILILGVRESAYIAGVVNLLIAGIVLALDWGLGIHRVADSDPKKRKKDPAETREDVFSSKEARLALWAVGLSGFCALALEVFWTRALVFFLDNSTHAFTTILTAFLLGIAIGSFVIARFVDTRRKLLAGLGLIEVLVGVFAIVAIPILGNLTPVLESLAGASRDSMLYWKWTGMRFTTSLTVMLAPTVLMGMTFPLVSKIYTRDVGMVGTALGNVYSANTIGGVFGSVIAGFVLIPFLGVQNGIILIAAVSVMVGGILILSDPLMIFRQRIAAVAGSGLLFISLGTFFLTTGAITLTSYTEKRESAEVLFYEEGIGATVKVFEDRSGDRVLSIDGFPVAGTSLVFDDTQKALGHLPLLLSNASSPSVNIIGFGAGGTSWAVMQYDVREVDCVELVPAVPDAAGWFPEINHGVLNEPRFNLILGDGRNHARVTDKTYDVISVDATSPKMAGNGSLYALEFYELLKDRLSEDGLVVQWLPLHLLSDEEIRMTAKTFQTVFPHTTLWLTPFRQYSILVGTQEELELDFASLSAKMGIPKIQRELAQLGVTDPIDLLSWFAMGEEALAGYVGDARINTDNHPYLEFFPALFYFLSVRYQLENTLNIHEHRESVLPFLTNTGETDEEVAAVAEKVRERFEQTQTSIMEDILAWLSRFQEE
jgi:spermidine synthase